MAQKYILERIQESNDLELLDGKKINIGQEFPTVFSTKKTKYDPKNDILKKTTHKIKDPDFQENMDEFVKTLPAIFKEVRVGVADFRKIIGGFSGVGEKVVENIDNVTLFTESLGKTGPEVIEEINGGVKDIRTLIANAEGLGKTFENLQKTFGNPNGTVGKLFNDSEAYDEALESIRNIRQVTDEVRRLSSKLEPLMNLKQLMSLKRLWKLMQLPLALL